MRYKGRVLHICTITPKKIAGGNIAVLADTYMLTSVFDKVDYLGRYELDKEWEKLYDKCFYDDRQFGRGEKAFNYLLNHYDDFFLFWKKVSRKIDFGSYDFVFLEMAKFEYIVKDLKRNRYDGVTILRSHNVEKNFFNALYSNGKKLINWIKSRTISRKEELCLKLSNEILCITKNDAEQIKDIYGIPFSKISVLPVGVDKGYENESFIPDVDFEQKKITCLMTGSLWFGPNIKGIQWFIENVFDSVSDICELVIAGYKPIPELVEVCEKKKIKLIDSPVTMKPIFEQADMFLAPIFHGSGMKVKIAEAMSFGLPIVTTYHGAIGYDIDNKTDGYVANDDKDFTEYIKEYYIKPCEEKTNFRKKVYRKYLELYSYESMGRTLEHWMLEKHYT